ncbi:MAG: hypothetical protein Q7S64_01160 [bacterium]|nr:hypothetical protein [bacterium]
MNETSVAPKTSSFPWAAVLLTALVVGILVFIGQELRFRSIIKKLQSTAQTSTATVTPTSSVPTTDSKVVSPAATDATVAETVDQTAIKAAITTAMAAKYKKDESEVKITLSQVTADFAKGSVSFGDEMGGGWLLAAKVNDKWKIVDDGNGVIDCAVIKPFNFPTDMVSECYDTATQALIER